MGKSCTAILMSLISLHMLLKKILNSMPWVLRYLS